jgi:hypothetical protein
VQLQPVSIARWRSWLLAVVSGLGVLASLGGSLFISVSGIMSLVGNQTPVSEAASILNLAWASALVGLLCIPSLI